MMMMMVPLLQMDAAVQRKLTSSCRLFIRCSSLNIPSKTETKPNARTSVTDPSTFASTDAVEMLGKEAATDSEFSLVGLMTVKKADFDKAGSEEAGSEEVGSEETGSDKTMAGLESLVLRSVSLCLSRSTGLGCSVSRSLGCSVRDSARLLFDLGLFCPSETSAGGELCETPGMQLKVSVDGDDDTICADAGRDLTSQDWTGCEDETAFI